MMTSIEALKEAQKVKTRKAERVADMALYGMIDDELVNEYRAACDAERKAFDYICTDDAMRADLDEYRRRSQNAL